MSETVSTTID